MSLPDPAGATLEDVALAAPDAASVQPTATLSRGRLVFRRFIRRKIALVGLAVIAILFIGSFVVPHFYKWDHQTLDLDLFLTQDTLFSGPSWDHWFGTTQTGADTFAQTMRGLQKSLLIGLITALLATTTAALVGTCAGYFGGWTDRILMWVSELLLVLPSFLILVIMSPTFKGGSWYILPLLLAGFGWMITSRVIRGMTLSLKEREFVQAARFMGVPARKIITRHLLPNMASFLIIDATLAVGFTILGETGLSYLGFGVQTPDVSLGTVIAEGANFFTTRYWWLLVFPGGILILTVLAVSVVGDCLRDAFDPNASRAKTRASLDEYSDEADEGPLLPTSYPS